MTSSPSSTAEVLDLDSLLSESVTLHAQASKVKVAQSRILGGMASPEDLARVRNWQAAHEWSTEAQALMVTSHRCACGAPPQLIFLGFALRQRHRTLKHGAMRWLPCKREELPLEKPKEIHTSENHINICPSCAPARGWLEESALVAQAPAQPGGRLAEGGGLGEVAGFDSFDTRLLPLGYLE